MSRPRTASELFEDLAQDDGITEVVVVYKKTFNKGQDDEEEAFVCESTSMNMADLCLAEKTLHINVNRIVSQDSEHQGWYQN